MGRVTEKRQCPICEDSGCDNLAIYEDGSGFCWSCNGIEGKYFSASELGGEESPVRDNTSVGTETGMIQGYYSALINRAIDEATCKKYQYQLAKYQGKQVHVANYCTQLGGVIAQKVRFANKGFSLMGDSQHTGLYGMHMFNPNPKLMVTITEGEIDCLSVAQVFQCKYPVVSLVSGSGKGAIKCIKANLEWLSGFKTVVLALDNDEAGRLTTAAICELLEPGKVKIVSWPEGIKDANDLLVLGRDDEIRKSVMFAKDFVPESILEVEDLLEAALEDVEIGLSWPWESMTRLTYGIRLHELYTFGAGSGIGKTEVFKDVGLHLAFTHEQPIAIISVEQPPKVTLQRFIGGLMCKRIHIPGTKYDKVKAREEGLKLNGKVTIWDSSKDGCSFDRVLSKIRYFVKGKGIKYVFLDHITAIAATIQGDERRGLDTIMSTLGKLVQELDCSIFLVSHLSKPSKLSSAKNKNDRLSYEEGRKVSADAFRGSQSIQYWSTFMFGLERNKAGGETVTTIRVLKDRLSGESDGEMFCVEYNRVTGRLEEL